MIIVFTDVIDDIEVGVLCGEVGRDTVQKTSLSQ
jgi:hypothetical protein